MDKPPAQYPGIPPGTITKTLREWGGGETPWPTPWLI